MLIEHEGDLPDLTAAHRVAVDIETNDPRLKTHGPGDVRRDGYIAGVAVAVDDGPAVYASLRHPDSPSLDRDAVTRWLRDTLGRPGIEITGANVNQYDRGWLWNDLGVAFHPTSRVMDVQIVEPLLDEHAKSYALDALAKRWLGPDVGKDDAELYQHLAQHFGGRPTRKAQGGRIHRAPARIVAPYAVSDVRLPLQILPRQLAEIERQGLNEVLRLELDDAHVVYLMRQRGVPVDLEATSIVAERLNEEAASARRRLGDASVWAPHDLVPLLESEGVEVPKTERGNPSMTAAWLKDQRDRGSRVAEDILTVRRADKAVGTFIDGHIRGYATGGRVHAQYNQLRGDEFGTVSGRFSSSNPNLQQIPARDPELGPLIRGLFRPEPGEWWYSHDYSQIEPRLALHYADAGNVRALYHDNPELDCYTALMETAPELDRKTIKSIWLGLMYRMGLEKLAADLKTSKSAAQGLIDTFHMAAPYIRDLMKKAERKASRRGYLVTLSGRRARFPFWQPAEWELSKSYKPRLDRQQLLDELTYDGVTDRRLKRAYTHKALNRLIQGGAADIMKYAMAQQWRAGIYDVLGPPLVTVHDELGWSVPDTREGLEAVAEARRIQTEAVSLRIPLHVDEAAGRSWGEAAD